MRIAWFFFDHSVNDIGPTVATITMLGCVGYHAMLGHPVVNAGVFSRCVGFRVGIRMNPVRLNESVLVAEMSA